MREAVGFRGIEGLPGFSIMDAVDTDRRWQVFNVQYALAVSVSWAGDAVYRGRSHGVSPGMVFCTEPGETHTTPRVHEVGTFHVLFCDPTVFSEHLTELGIRGGEPRWRQVTDRLAHGLHDHFLRLFRPSRPMSAFEQQSLVAGIVESTASDLVQHGLRKVRDGAGGRLAERIRELLHSSEGDKTDLESLSRRLGVSRFQAIRAFKRRYGLPPHAYQLSRRLWTSRSLLVEGRSIADVAAECGFADQSHFTRHFKRIFGVTPASAIQSVGTRGRALRAVASRIRGSGPLANRDRRYWSSRF